MKKLTFFICALFLFAIAESCSQRENEKNVVTVKDDIKPPFTIKYELIFPPELYQKWANLSWVMPLRYTTDQNYYSPSLLNFSLKRDDIINNKWTKTVTANLLVNPYQSELLIDTGGFRFANTGGTIIMNIYVNNNLYSSGSFKVNSTGSYNGVSRYGIGTLIY